VAAPSHPSLFMKMADALVAHEGYLEPPIASSQLDYEAELTIVIGRSGRAIPSEEALAHVAGYTCMNDGSVRDYQGHSVWAGKNFFRSGAIGPWIVTADEIPDSGVLRLTSRLNGREVQATGTGAMFFTVPAIIAYLSTITPLRAGDMIATGSPSGTGATQTPPRFLVPGDRLEVEIDRIGTLATTVGPVAQNATV
jgi:2-keto-4-pentenoate hydratase/2-oxohepta-3-ene-1,7-dioic acid hydratase in catechol pathway